MTYKQIREIHNRVADYICRHQDQTYYQMADELAISVPMLSKIARAHGIERRPAAKKRTPQSVADLLAKLEQ